MGFHKSVEKAIRDRRIIPGFAYDRAVDKVKEVEVGEDDAEDVVFKELSY